MNQPDDIPDLTAEAEPVDYESNRRSMVPVVWIVGVVLLGTMGGLVIVSALRCPQSHSVEAPGR